MSRPFNRGPLPIPPCPTDEYIGLAARESQSLFDWNSFPSDHAALFFSLAMGIFMISRRVGVAVFLYVLLIIALPRVYLGLHYATDIVVGAAIGMASVWLCTRQCVVKLYGAQCMALLARYPALFQSALFIGSVEMSMMFSNVRRLIGMVKIFF